MAIDLTLNTITSGFNLSKLNENFVLIDTALQEALSRSGTSPNTMTADIDLNGNDLLNVGSLGISGGVTLSDIVDYAEEWAISPEDDPVSVAAGGDASTTFSSLHWAAKSAADAVLAAAAAATLQGTSTTSLTIGTGSKVFTTQSGKQFDAGAWLLVTSDANITNYMHGQVTSYSGTTLTVNVTNIGGSGTLADWTIDVAGTRGAVGPSSGGDVVGPASATDNAVALYDGTTGKLLKDGVVLGTVAILDTGTNSGDIPLVGTKSATLTLAGLIEQSTSAENVTGTDDTVFPSVAGTKEMINTHAISGPTSATAVATTSGTSIDFTSIPSGTTRINIILAGISTSGTSMPAFQIGDSGGIETTGYIGSALTTNPETYQSPTTLFSIGGSNWNATKLLGGIAVLNLVDSANNIWAFNSLFGDDGNSTFLGGGNKTLSATLDRIRLTTAGGTDTFDAGTMNIIYD